MRKKIFVIFLILNISGGGVYSQTSKFNHSIFSIEYSSSWEKIIGYASTEIAVLSPYINDHTYRQNFNVIVSYEKRTYDVIWASVKSQMTKYANGFKVINRNDYLVSKVNGKRTEYNAYLENVFIRFITYEFLHKGNLITITFCTEETKFQLQKKNVEKIINTLKLL